MHASAYEAPKEISLGQYCRSSGVAALAALGGTTRMCRGLHQGPYTRQELEQNSIGLRALYNELKKEHFSSFIRKKGHKIRRQEIK